MPPDRLVALPVLLLPRQDRNAIDQGGTLLIGGMAGLVVLAGVILAWKYSQTAGIAVSAIAVLIAGLCIGFYLKQAREADRSLIIAHDALWLGDEEITWDRLSSLAIEEIEQETAPSEYRVTFCVPGVNTFGKWYALNPRTYVRHVSGASRADALFRCISEAKRRYLAEEFKKPDAVTAVSPHLHTSVDDVGSLTAKQL